MLLLLLLSLPADLIRPVRPPVRPVGFCSYLWQQSGGDALIDHFRFPHSAARKQLNQLAAVQSRVERK